MKFALVTGGSRGIGRAVCLKLADMQYHILLNYKSNDEEANKTKELIEAKGLNCELLKFDVSDKEQTDKAIEHWIESNKDHSIEVLVNNAGIRDDGLLMWMNENQWKGVLSTNLDSFYYVTRLVIAQMLANKSGRIINMVSLSGVKGMAGQTNYSAAKAGLIGATKALAQEVGRRGITVNAVAPGFIETEMTAALDQKTLSALVPMRRFGKAEEVAEAVAFFASPASSYITGEVLNVNGGLHT